MNVRLEIKEINVAKNMIDALVLNGYKVWCKHLYGLPYNIFFEIDDNAVFKTEDIKKTKEVEEDQKHDKHTCLSCKYKDKSGERWPCKYCAHNQPDFWEHC